MFFPKYRYRFCWFCSRVSVDGVSYQNLINGYMALKAHVVCGIDRDADVGMQATGAIVVLF